MLKPIATAAIVALLAGAAPAQTTAPATGGRTGGLAGLLGGGGLPNIAGIGAGNAAGLLGYCLKNNLLDGAGGGLAGIGSLGGLATPTPAPTATPPAATGSAAQSILQRLTGRQGVASSTAYAAGQAGQVQAGNGQSFSLDSLRGQVKTRVCSLVLNRAKSFL